MFQMRTYTLLLLLLINAVKIHAQTGFTGIFNGAPGSITIGENDTLYIDGNLENNNDERLNINNQGTIILKGNLINHAGELFSLSTHSFDSLKKIVNIKGNVVFAGTKKQIIRGKSILFAKLTICDTVELHSDIHVLDTLKLNQCSKPSLLLLGTHTLKMYEKDNNFKEKTYGGIIEGEDETHYITSDTIGIIKMQKERDTSSFGMPALASMGLDIIPDEYDSYEIIVKRYHIKEKNAAMGSIKKYYSIKNKGIGFDTLSINHFTHDRLTEHNNLQSLRLFFSQNDGDSYKLIDSKSINERVTSTGNVEIETDTIFRYTVAASCEQPGLKLVVDSTQSLCANSKINVKPVWTMGRPIVSCSYFWNNEEDTIKTDTSKEFLLDKDTVTITIKVIMINGCTAHDTLIINPFPVTKAKIVPLETYYRCISDTWIFKADTTFAKFTPEYNWNLGDNTTAIGDSVTKKYTSGRKYQVLLSVKNQFGCSDSTFIDIKMDTIPKPNFKTVIMAEKLIKFIDKSQTFSFSNTKLSEWEILDTIHYKEDSIVYKFPDFGEYPIKLKVTGELCSATLLSSINVTAKGSLGFSIASTCSGDELQFINESECLWGELVYNWDFGDCTTSNSDSPIKTYNGDETVYTVTLHAMDPVTGWNSSITRDITIQRPPKINWGGAISTCANHFVLQPEEEGYTYLWSNGSTSEFIDVTQSGEYSLKLTGINGCTSFESVKITLNSGVVPTINDAQSCGGIILDAGNPKNSEYKWNTGETTRTLVVEKSGTYRVEVKQSNGCTGSKEVQIVIKQKPEVKINCNSTLCSGSTATLFTEPKTNTVYRWNTGEITPSITITGGGWYQVKATNSSSLCTASDSLYVAGLVSPVIELGRDRNICLGQETILTMDDYYYATSVEWWKDGGKIYNDRSFAVSDTGSYNLRVTLANGCSTTDRIRFGGIVTPLTVDFLVASQSYVGDSLVFIDLSYPDPTTWNWEISSGFRIDKPIFSYAFWNEGEYSVKLSVGNDGCVLSKTKTITVGDIIKSGGDNDDTQKKDDDVIYIKDIPEKQIFIDPANITEAIAIPNPSDGNLRIQVKLTHPSRMLARLYNSVGQIASSFIIPQQTEDVLYYCNFSNLPTGVYLLQLWTDDDVKILKIVIGK